MKSFKRKNIPHLVDVAESKFSSLLNKRIETFYITEKIDGFSLKIGKTEEGEPFIASARSGQVTKVGDFTKYCEAKGKDVSRGKHYDDIFELLLRSSIFDSIEAGTIYYFEARYLPMATRTENGVKFVSHEYPLNQFTTALNLSYIKHHGLNSERIFRSFPKLEFENVSVEEIPVIKTSIDMYASFPSFEGVKFYIRCRLVNDFYLQSDKSLLSVEGIVVESESLGTFKITNRK